MRTEDEKYEKNVLKQSMKLTEDLLIEIIEWVEGPKN